MHNRIIIRDVSKRPRLLNPLLTFVRLLSAEIDFLLVCLFETVLEQLVADIWCNIEQTLSPPCVAFEPAVVMQREASAQDVIPYDVVDTLHRLLLGLCRSSSGHSPLRSLARLHDLSFMGSRHSKTASLIPASVLENIINTPEITRRRLK